MNLLTYTKQLYEKINFYDKLFKQQNLDISMTNPFAKPLNITIIWLESDEK